MPDPTPALRPQNTLRLEWLTWVILGLAGLLTAIWLWSCWCSFPSNPWNDIRVAPALALSRGVSIYTPAGAGPVSTWVYGPLPLLVLAPAGLAPTAAGAIQVAGAIHILLRVLVVVLVCLLWPRPVADGNPTQSRQRRLAAVLIAVLLARNESSGYVVYTADSPGLVFALLSLLTLARGRYWLAAVAAVAAAACKQTLIGVALVQVLWLCLAISPREAGWHIARCTVIGAIVAGSALAYFGFAGLWHTMIEIPGRFPWAPVGERLLQHRLYLLWHVGVPLAVMAAGWRTFFARQSPLLLPALAFLGTLPLSLAGLLKIGGNVNGLHSFWLWLPPVLAVLASSRLVARGGAGGFVAAGVATALACTWIQHTALRLRPNLQAYHEAAALAAQLPQQVWFPMHPSVTLYSDRRFYHDFDGILERTIAGQRLSDAHFYAGLPARLRVTATLLPIGWGPADQTEARLPPNLPVSTYGNWQLQGAP